MKKSNPTKKLTLEKELLAILCCPNCHGDLDYSAKKNTLRCKNCRTVYPVRDNIPIMLGGETDKGRNTGASSVLRKSSRKKALL